MSKKTCLTSLQRQQRTACFLVLDKNIILAVSVNSLIEFQNEAINENEIMGFFSKFGRVVSVSNTINSQFDVLFIYLHFYYYYLINANKIQKLE